MPLEAQETQPEARLTQYHGDVRWLHDQFEDPVTQTNLSLRVGNGVKTLENSTAVVWFRNDNCSVKLSESSSLRIGQPKADSSPLLHLFEGALYFFSRERSREAQIWTPHATGAPRGTEFVMSVVGNQTVLIMLDGIATLTNAWGETNLQSGELGIAADGAPPIKLGLGATNIVQWWLYYPGVLDPDELGLSNARKEAWATSLQAYRRGDLRAALTSLPNYPNIAVPTSDAERIYLAGLYLAASQVKKAQDLVDVVPQTSSLAAALRWVIAAVQLKLDQSPGTPGSASEWLGLSYYYQARSEPQRLEKALWAATNAVGKSPNFGFAWERVAELEFGFGRIGAAKDALEKSIELTPRNAQAHALRGFVLSAENRLWDARTAFDRSIGLDSSLGNAWLGRGLVRIRKGDREGGRMDLQTAVILEPNRSLLRSYLGKAFADAGAEVKAESELTRAIGLDQKDPTPWLYSALLKQQENRINEAIADLEKSQELNGNRSLYRSRLLLDQDQAVRSANLASIYGDAGMFDVSTTEAGSAVTRDYANYSAHLFLANSYNALRDPNLINLRYESATFSEYLTANLLSPVGGSKLSPYVSQQEYSKLFEQEGLGFSSETTYLSRGDCLQQASQYGWFKDTGYALDVYYRTQNGERPNNDAQQTAVSLEVKQQLTPKDSVYLQSIFSGFESGDLRQFYDQHLADPNLRIKDDQTPNLFFGYHHEWSPGMHTLVLASRLEDRTRLNTEDVVIPGVIRDDAGAVIGTLGGLSAGAETFDTLKFHSSFVAYSAELQQIAQVSTHTLIGGIRYQSGQTETRSEQTRFAGDFPPYGGGDDFVALQNVENDLSRLSVYGYDQWQLVDPFWLTLGVSYDVLHFPRNVDSPPITDEERTSSRVSPKAGFVWRPAPGTTIRGAFTRSLGGLFYDASVRLEPVQVAGFNQAYRSLIPESVVGAIAGSKFQTFDLGFEQKFRSRTYLVLQLELLQSDASQDVGAFDFDPTGVQDAAPTQLPHDLKYEERSVLASVNQLVGQDWTFGAHYRVSDADLKTSYPGVSAAFFPDTHNSALLHTVDFYALFNHPSGFFAEAQALWRGQTNYHYEPALPGDDFWQFNLYGGYRFARRRAELSLGLLNLFGQDYHLNPLDLYQELPRQRTLLVNLKLNF